MKSVSISEFKAKCLRLVAEAQTTGEPLEVSKRGKLIAIVNPAPSKAIDWNPGAFKDQTHIIGNVEADLSDLGIEWEAMQ